MMLHVGEKQTGLKIDYSGILADITSKKRNEEQIFRDLTELHAQSQASMVAGTGLKGARLLLSPRR